MYKPTLFDRLGPDAGHVVRAAAYGVMVFGLCIPLFAAASQKLEHPLSLGWMIPWVFGCSLVCAAFATGVGLLLSGVVGDTWKHLTVSGSSTPYKEQYSYQQALVMRGQLDDALESFEAVIAEHPASIDARIRAAELYSREKRNHQRAAELFRDVQRIATVTPGEDIYVTNRLVDLLTGPLGDPGRALAELRRLVDRYPDSAGATHARGALVALKATVIPSEARDL
jgi:tetratricopeptide (TPR) repeat protein